MASDEALRFVEEFVDWAQENLGEVRVDYSPQPYIGIRRGRRVWPPLWLRCAMVYLPDPDGPRDEQPSVPFDYLVERQRSVGLEPSWQRTYNAGANPVSIRLRHADLAKEPVRELPRASFQIRRPERARFHRRESLMVRRIRTHACSHDGGVPVERTFAHTASRRGRSAVLGFSASCGGGFTIARSSRLSTSSSRVTRPSRRLK